MPFTSHAQPLDTLLHKLDGFATLSNEERGAIQSLPANVRQLKAGQDIVRDGDKPTQSCLLVEGWAFRYKLIHEGRRQIFSFHVPGDIPDLQSLHIHTMDHS